jgi:hypothetical protein
MSTADEIHRRQQAAEAILRAYMASSSQMHEHMRDAFAYGMGAATFSHGAAGPRYQRHAPEDLYQRPPLHGAIDLDRGADGVWRLPTPYVFGFDMAQPGSDRTVYWSFRK